MEEEEVFFRMVVTVAGDISRHVLVPHAADWGWARMWQNSSPKHIGGGGGDLLRVS